MDRNGNNMWKVSFHGPIGTGCHPRPLRSLRRSEGQRLLQGPERSDHLHSGPVGLRITARVSGIRLLKEPL